MRGLVARDLPCIGPLRDFELALRSHQLSQGPVDAKEERDLVNESGDDVLASNWKDPCRDFLRMQRTVRVHSVCIGFADRPHLGTELVFVLLFHHVPGRNR